MNSHFVVGELIPESQLRQRFARWAIDRCGGDECAAARALAISLETLRRRAAIPPKPPGGRGKPRPRQPTRSAGD